MTAKIKPNLYNLEKIFTMPQFSKTLLRKYENHVIQERQCFFKWRSLKNFLNYKVTYFWNYQNHKLQSYKSWIFKDIKGNKERKLYILSVLSWNRLSLSNEAETAFIDFRTKKKMELEHMPSITLWLKRKKPVSMPRLQILSKERPTSPESLQRKQQPKPIPKPT